MICIPSVVWVSSSDRVDISSELSASVIIVAVLAAFADDKSFLAGVTGADTLPVYCVLHFVLLSASASFEISIAVVGSLIRHALHRYSLPNDVTLSPLANFSLHTSQRLYTRRYNHLRDLERHPHARFLSNGLQWPRWITLVDSHEVHQLVLPSDSLTYLHITDTRTAFRLFFCFSFFVVFSYRYFLPFKFFCLRSLISPIAVCFLIFIFYFFSSI